MSVADFVAPGRCDCCGQSLPTWTPNAIAEAARRWHGEHGRSPSSRDWREGGYGHPTRDSVYTVFGTWPSMLSAAGLPEVPRGPRGPRVWTRDRIADAMLTWLFRNGRWPTVNDWETAGPGHPCTHTVYRTFGSWVAAKRAAGWDGRHPNARRESLPAARCSECDTELENTTLGCATCHDRRQKRLSRQAEPAARTLAREATGSDERKVAA